MLGTTSISKKKTLGVIFSEQLLESPSRMQKPLARGKYTPAGHCCEITSENIISCNRNEIYQIRIPKLLLMWLSESHVNTCNVIFGKPMPEIAWCNWNVFFGKLIWKKNGCNLFWLECMHFPCSDGITKLCRACLYGVSHNYCAICCKMGYCIDVPVCACLQILVVERRVWKCDWNRVWTCRRKTVKKCRWKTFRQLNKA